MRRGSTMATAALLLLAPLLAAGHKSETCEEGKISNTGKKKGGKKQDDDDEIRDWCADGGKCHNAKTQQDMFDCTTGGKPASGDQSCDFEDDGGATVSGNFKCTCEGGDTRYMWCCTASCDCARAPKEKMRRAHPMAAAPRRSATPLDVTATHFWTTSTRGRPEMYFYFPTWCGGNYGYTCGNRELKSTHRTAVLISTHMIEQVSCFKFIEVNTDSCTASSCPPLEQLDQQGKRYTKIQSKHYNPAWTDPPSGYSGCSGSANVPWPGAKHQSIWRPNMNLSPGCYKGYTGVIVHEFMHLLGFRHEQSRPDRDNYITIQISNANSGATHNFNKMSTDDWHHAQGTDGTNDIGQGDGTDWQGNAVAAEHADFDFESIMLYGSWTFAAGSAPTMVRVSDGSTWDSKQQLSESDIAQLNHLYECSAPTAATPTVACNVGTEEDVCSELMDAALKTNAQPRQLCEWAGGTCQPGKVCTDKTYNGQRFFRSVTWSGGSKSNLYCTCVNSDDDCFGQQHNFCDMVGDWASTDHGGTKGKDMCCACGGGDLTDGAAPVSNFPTTCSAVSCPTMSTGAGSVAAGKPLRKSGSDSTSCDSDADCEASCCAESALCKDHGCAAGTHTPAGQVNRNCNAASCSDAQCCADNEHCPAHTCPAGMYMPNSGANSVSSKVCAAEECTDGECCKSQGTCAGVTGCTGGMTVKASRVCYQDFAGAMACDAARCCVSATDAWDCEDKPAWTGGAITCPIAAASPSQHCGLSATGTDGLRVDQACCACSAQCTDSVPGWTWNGVWKEGTSIYWFGAGVQISCSEMAKYGFCQEFGGKNAASEGITQIETTEGKTANDACCACGGGTTTHPDHWDYPGNAPTPQPTPKPTQPPPVVHCEVSDWGWEGQVGSWSPCTKTCGGGTMKQTRTVTVQKANGGSDCPELQRSQACGGSQCPVDCVYGQWSQWSACTVTCGTGQKMRTREVETAPVNGGKACDEVGQSAETGDCTEPACPKDCVAGTWGQWSECIAKPDPAATAAPSPAATAGPASAPVTCNYGGSDLTGDAILDCDDWFEAGNPPATSGGDFCACCHECRPLEQDPAVPFADCGQCPVTTHTTNCGGKGVMHRNRTVQDPEVGSGKACGQTPQNQLHEEEECNLPDCQQPLSYHYVSNGRGSGGMECVRDDTRAHQVNEGQTRVGHYVRCCLEGDVTPTGNYYWRKNSQCVDGGQGASKVSSAGCSGEMTFQEAEEFCDVAGAMLCTLEQMESQCTKGSGCGYDNRQVWTDMPCDPPTGKGAVTVYGRVGRGPQGCADPLSPNAYVQCCSKRGPEIGNSWKKRGGCSVWSERDGKTNFMTASASGGSCSGKKSYREAVAWCAAYKLNGESVARLCTEDEVAQGCTRGTGCGYDNVPVWALADPHHAAEIGAICLSKVGPMIAEGLTGTNCSMGGGITYDSTSFAATRDEDCGSTGGIAGIVIIIVLVVVSLVLGGLLYLARSRAAKAEEKMMGMSTGGVDSPGIGSMRSPQAGYELQEGGQQKKDASPRGTPTASKTKARQAPEEQADI